MTGAAMFERTRSDAVRLSIYFKKKYRLQIALRSIPVGLAISALILFLAGAAGYERVYAVFDETGLLPLAAAAAAATAVITVLYVCLSVFIIGRRWENLRGSYVRYRLSLDEISKKYENNTFIEKLGG